MAKIKIDPEILRSSSTAINTKINELEGYNGKLKNIIEEIHTTWSGKASEKYYSLMLDYQKKAQTMVSVLLAFKKYSDSAVNKFETLDKESANKIRNSF